MTNTWSTSWTISSSTVAGVAGLMATPTRLPRVLIRWTVRCRLLLPSQWTRNESEPAGANSSRNRSGAEIIRWISSGRCVTRRSDSTTNPPIERYGRNRPSRPPARMPPLADPAVRSQRRELKEPVSRCSRVGRLEDVLNRCFQPRVVLSIGLLGRESFDERTREARHHAVIPPQALVAFRLRVSARQRDHPHDFGIADELGV